MTSLVAELDLKGGYPDTSVHCPFLFSSHFYQKMLWGFFLYILIAFNSFINSSDRDENFILFLKLKKKFIEI